MFASVDAEAVLSEVSVTPSYLSFSGVGAGGNVMRDAQPWTPLMWAIRSGSDTVAILLIRVGASVNAAASDDVRTLLRMQAIKMCGVVHPICVVRVASFVHTMC
jgi:hypothetical protein